MLIFSLRMCGRLGPGGLVLPILLQIYDLLFIGQRELGGNFTCLFIVCRKAVSKKGVSDGGLRGCAEILDFIPVGQPSSFGNCIGQKQDVKSQ